MVAYRDLMFILVLLFTVITLLMIPAFIFYKSGTGISIPKGYTKFSLGNLGYSSSQCTRVPFDLNRIPMYCPYGNISTIAHFGINPSNMTDKDSCSNASPDTLICASSLNQKFIDNIKQLVVNPITNDFTHTFTESEIFTDPATAPHVCKSKGAQLYIQYACTQDVETLKTKYN